MRSQASDCPSHVSLGASPAQHTTFLHSAHEGRVMTPHQARHIFHAARGLGNHKLKSTPQPHVLQQTHATRLKQHDLKDQEKLFFAGNHFKNPLEVHTRSTTSPRRTLYKYCYCKSCVQPFCTPGRRADFTQTTRH